MITKPYLMSYRSKKLLIYNMKFKNMYLTYSICSIFYLRFKLKVVLTFRPTNPLFVMCNEPLNDKLFLTKMNIA